MTFHFLALKIRSRTSVVQVDTAVHASLCMWILTICRVGAGGGIWRVQQVSQTVHSSFGSLLWWSLILYYWVWYF